MNRRSLWIYFFTAVVLASLAALHHYAGRPDPVQAQQILPGLRSSAVKALTIYLVGQPEIRLERADDSWQLTAPLAYPAQSHLIEALLTKLEKLTPASTISAAELKGRAQVDEEFGFKTPRATLLLEQSDYRAQVVVGSLTAPGDQFFMKVVGQGAVHVIDAGMLGLIPRSVNDVRDTALLKVSKLAFDHLAVQSGQLVFELERHPQTKRWRMVHPIDRRADDEHIRRLLEKLEIANVKSFVTDDPKTDLEAYGLQPAALELSFKEGTNIVSSLRIGRSLTNDQQQVYARVGGRSTIVTVSREDFASWRGTVNDFRDPRLIGMVEAPTLIQVQGRESFSLERGTNGAWTVLPQKYPADRGLVDSTLNTLVSMRIVDFTKDVVTPADLPLYGLASPSLKYVLASVARQTNAPATNNLIVQLEFGTNVNDRVYARRPDESSVYAVSQADFRRLPSLALQFRERRLWDISEDSVTNVIVRHSGKVRELERRAAHDWALREGSQGVINELAIEETVRPLCRLEAQAWVAVGAERRKDFGFSDTGHQVTIEFKNGVKKMIEFGAPTGADSAFAAVTLDQQTWIFEMPSGIYRFVATYLDIPAGLP